MSSDWHTLSADEAVTRLGTNPSRGLAAEEAARRLAEHGPNELAAVAGTPAWKVLLDQFRNVLIVILLVAVGLSAFLGHAVEAITIAVIVLFAVVLGFVQEYRAERAIDALRRMAAPLAEVVRDGRTRSRAARDLVPGDLILLKAGARVPADARVVAGYNLRVEEAVLTGESVPVGKDAAAVAAAAAPLGDRYGMLFAGTTIAYGRGRAVVVGTGQETEFGRIAKLLQTVEAGKTPLARNLNRVGSVLAKVALVVVLVIAGLGVLRGQPLLDMFLFGIALAVAVVPEALPAVVSISLALGVQRMVERHSLVRKLSAVETLGSTTVICSDKTGTLTRNEMTVRRLWADGLGYDLGGVGYEPSGSLLRDGQPLEPPSLLVELLEAATLCNDSNIVEDEGEWTLDGEPTEGALVVAAAKLGIDHDSLSELRPRTDEIPFSSESKRMTTLHAVDDQTVAYVKGAPEVVVGACTGRRSAAGDVPLDDAGRDEILREAQAMAGDALRMIAVATKAPAALDDVDDGLTLLGLVGMIDPPREEAGPAIEVCRRAGIRPVMITGDHLTATAVARELDILSDGRVVTGAELDRMDDAELAAAVSGIEVYARVSPEHKLRVVAALEELGEIVAMTGDGVNDAPALKKADIGVAMGVTGTDVSREAAEMTLTDDNFASIVAAVEEGRGIFDNIKKYLMYLLSSNLGEILLIASTSFAGLPLPLTAALILYVNLATDGLPALALAVDPYDDHLMRRHPRNPHRGVFTRPVLALMIAGGLWSAIANLVVFVWALRSGREQAVAVTIVFASLTIIQFVKAYALRSDRRTMFVGTFRNRWLNLAVLWESALLVLIVTLPFFQRFFATRALSAVEWTVALVAALSVVPVLELVKLAVRRGWLGEVD